VADHFQPGTHGYSWEGFLQYSSAGKTPSPAARSRALRANCQANLRIAAALRAAEEGRERKRAKRNALPDRRALLEPAVCYVQKKHVTESASQDQATRDPF